MAESISTGITLFIPAAFPFRFSAVSSSRHFVGYCTGEAFPNDWILVSNTVSLINNVSPVIRIVLGYEPICVRSCNV